MFKPTRRSILAAFLLSAMVFPAATALAATRPAVTTPAQTYLAALSQAIPHARSASLIGPDKYPEAVRASAVRASGGRAQWGRGSSIVTAARRAVISDPTAVAVDPADWSATNSWGFQVAAGLDDTNVNPMREFHKISYSKSGLLMNGECGQDRNGDPYSFICSAFQQEGVIAIGVNHTISAYYVGSLYTTAAKATARFQDAVSNNKNGVSCGLSGAASHCKSWLYAFQDSHGKTVAIGVYTAFAIGNALGETVLFSSPADFGNGKGTLGQAFLQDVRQLTLNGASVLLANSEGAKRLMSDPLEAAVPFGLWPAVNASSAGYLTPQNADKTGANPIRSFHSKTYTASGMRANGSCGDGSNGKPLPKKCGGVIQSETVAIGSPDSHTFAITYVGTIYGSSTQALNHFKDSKAAKATSCASIGPNCRYLVENATVNGKKVVILYGVVPVTNGLAEVEVVAAAADWGNSAKQFAIGSSFLATLNGGFQTLSIA